MKFIERRNFSQRASDYLTNMVGSWTFIIALLVIMALWMVLNVWFIIGGRWDPYPFILLNFVLSTLAAIQAPIILMSQNREAERDRLEAKYDYEVNQKAEAEIEDMQHDLDEIKIMIKDLHEQMLSNLEEIDANLEEEHEISEKA